MADWFSENAPKPQAGGDWFASNAPSPGFGQRLYEQTLQGPVELAKGLWNDPKGTLMKTIASMAATQIQAARNPLQVQQGLATPIIEDVRSGNLPGLAGGVTGLALDVFAPKLLSKAPGAAKVAGAGVRAAAPDVAGGALQVGVGQLIDQMVPGAGYLKYAVDLPLAYSGAKQIGRGLKKGVAASREALKARAQAAAKALAAERAAAQPAPVPLIPEERRLNAPTPPPDTSYVRAVPADPLPPSRQLAAPGRPAIITPAPDPLAGDTSGVRAVPAVYGTSATNEAATGMREAMGLQPGELAPPAARTAPVTARASQIDQMARHMRQSGITATQAALLDPPELAGLAKAAGIEGALGKVAVAVRKRLAAMEKAEAETAKYQAAWDKLKPAEKAAVTGEAEAPAVERKPPASAPAAEPTVTTPADANVELGKSLSVEMPAEKPPALTASQKRVQGMAAILAEGEIPVEQLRGGLKTDVRARLFLESESRRLGYGKIAAGELDKIIAEIERLRAQAPVAK